ncbi:hypothetical protein BD626DRAFT_477847 [Schizophyllum amplum]|uniref:Uncharacterized protein n=1 Tax=Schizophyllum amplum TaxID=97359 RepID=A0A550D0K2_9AGAR|nr:hypothetical protein BD626DRAFT_477847 [Auriculariopsis ampla]
MSAADRDDLVLPAELIHEIFHLASASSKDSCMSLCLTASWTRTKSMIQNPKMKY